MCNQLCDAARVTAVAAPSTARLSSDDRRDSLLDVARRLVVDGGPATVTMGAVAAEAGVTRALVYKHFDNKDEILGALYRREAQALDRRIRTIVVAAPPGFEAKLRAFVGATLDAVDEYGDFFTPLRGVGRDRAAKREQRRWDRRTVGYFVTLATQELALDEEQAEVALSVLFSGIPSLLAQRRGRGRARQRAALEQTYVDLTLGALGRLAAGSPTER